MGTELVTAGTATKGRRPREQRAYWQEWYAKHRGQLMRQRRRRYVTDADYRERAKQQARDWYSDPVNREHKLGQTKVRQRLRAPLMLTIGRKEQAVEVRAYRLGELAGVVGVAKVTVMSWERDGILPAVTYRTAAGWRLYTEDQVACIAETYREVVPGPEKLGRFKDLVRARLARIPKGVGQWREQ